MKILVLCFSLILSVFAKEPGKISGTITDKQTGQPIEKVNVYIARTTLGAATNEAGSFELKNLPAGKYTLILSHLSYENQEIDVNIYIGTHLTFSFELKPRPIEFPEIDVIDKYDDEWWDNLEIFKKGLFGSAKFVDNCEILNPLIIDFAEDEKGNLVAYTNSPIEIINGDLGYKIIYTLKYFMNNFDTTRFSGFPFFKELTPKTQTDSIKWERNRLEAYMGSLRHFLRILSESYLSNEPFNLTDNKKFWKLVKSSYIYPHSSLLRENGFLVFQPLYETPNPGLHTIYFPMNPQKVITKSISSNDLFLKTDKPILVIFEKEYDMRVNGPQYSYIRLHADSVYFDKRGRYHDEFLLEKTGYMSKQRLAEMLPFDYEPSASLLINTDFR